MAKERTYADRIHRVRAETIGLLIATPIVVLGAGLILRWHTGNPVDVSILQAFFGLATVMLTIGLVGTTITYVLVTQQLADQARAANEQASPLLTLAVPVTMVLGPGGDAIVTIHVLNSGGGVATELVLHTDWKDPLKFDAAIGWHDPPLVLTYRRSRNLVHADTPVPVSWEFTDLSGTHYRQPVGGRPVPL